tara:strand:+ start:12684 stop:13436 length:753 start_codon:yes stop_codon:yes gene_type:complete
LQAFILEKSRYIFTSIFLCAVLALSAQISGAKKPRYVNENLPNFDYRPYHFGFTLSSNSSDFIVRYNELDANKDSLLFVENDAVPGFAIGIVSTYKLNKNIRLRFVPTLSFQDRKFIYNYKKSGEPNKTFEKIIKSTFVEFPVYIKLRTNRVGNAAGYVIGGAKAMIDMSSKKDVESLNDNDLVVKIDKYQFHAEFGGGFDFFLPYFKFGMEFKFGYGIQDVFIPQDHKFSAPIKSLVPRTYTFTLTFEG